MALTTHIGSLPRLDKLLDILKARYGGQPYDEAELNSILTQEVADCVRKQVECGIEIVTDGEYSKPGFFTYIRERFDGYESRPEQKLVLFQKEVSSFPEYYAQYFKEAMMGGAILPIVPVVCTGPIKYKGEEKLQIDIANVKAATRAVGVPDHHVFCQLPRPRALASTSTTRAMKSISTRSMPSSTRNTARSSPPAFRCR
jgi:5-methyltetrahydropteroyltriglutamate--homocysteine methyltransferase